MAENILSVENLEKSFGSLKAIDGVSLNLSRHNISILIGPNGSGKTTLVNTISGLYKPDSGKIAFEGKDVTGLAPYKLYRMGLARTFQIPALFWKLTVLENLLIADKENRGESFLRSPFKMVWVKSEKRATEKASRILSLLGLSNVWYQPASNLSGGQMKLVEIGRALRSEEHTSELQSPCNIVCRLLLEKKKLLHENQRLVAVHVSHEDRGGVC